MTELEIEKLRRLLAAEASDYAQMLHVSDEWIQLDENYSYSTTTCAEILVFGLEIDLLPRLQIAYMAYEELIDIIFPSQFSDEVHDLICKVRPIVPPLKSFDFEVPFETCMHAEQSFQWFAMKFLDLPYRQSAAIYAKHQWNNAHLTKFRLETP